MKALARNFYGIKEVPLVKAVGLDMEGANAEKKESFVQTRRNLQSEA